MDLILLSSYRAVQELSWSMKKVPCEEMLLLWTRSSCAKLQLCWEDETDNTYHFKPVAIDYFQGNVYLIE